MIQSNYIGFKTLIQEYNHDKAVTFLTTLRESHPYQINIFTKGGCYNLYLILKTIFPEAEAYTDENHVITKINNRFYDITGEVKQGKHIPLKPDDPSIPDMLKENWNT